MKLLTSALRTALQANAAAHAARAERSAEGAHDPVPVVKFFNPMGPATWLATELDADGDTLFGLADLGFGCPELGYFSLSEIAALRLPFGLRIERDIGFATTSPLSVWAEVAARSRPASARPPAGRLTRGAFLPQPSRSRPSWKERRDRRS